MEVMLPGSILRGNQTIKPELNVTEAKIVEKIERKVYRFRAPALFPEFPLKTSTRTPTYVPGNKVVVS